MTKELTTTGGGELAKYSPDKFNVLTPVVAQQDIPAGARMSVRVVTIDPSPKSGDTYRVADKVCLTKVAIERMAAAAGVSILDVTRTDDRTIPHVYGFRARIRVVDPDGLSREATGTKELDYRDSAKDAQGSTEAALRQKRKYAAEECASKALLRAMRSCLAIRSGYSAAELEKPFAIAKLILDTENDPDAKAAALAAMTNAQPQLYPPAERGSVGPDIVSEAKEEPTQEPTDDEPSQAAQKMLEDAWKYSRKSKIGKTEFTRLFKELGKERSEITVKDMRAFTDKLSIRAEELASEADEGLPV